MTVFLAQMQRNAKIMYFFMSTNRMKSTREKDNLAQTFLFKFMTVCSEVCKTLQFILQFTSQFISIVFCVQIGHIFATLGEKRDLIN